MLRIHNSLTRNKEEFQPLHAGKVGMYVCGMTIYDYCHVGHGRMLVAFDVIQRWLRASGYAVNYVRNITDIDDKIIRRAVENGETIGQLTQRFIQAMHEDLGALGVQPPDHEPRATEYLPQMTGMISELQSKGLAYAARNGDMNFAVRKKAGYGKLSGRTLDEMRAGERVAVSTAKEDPLDFVLWKAAKPDEPAEAKFDAPFGAGRPGWHIECSAMSSALLGETFDIHGGGEDLKFPHHENELAQSEGANDKPFVRYWMHNGFLQVNDEKMSKSLGNFFTIREVLKEFDAEVIRFFLLRAHYRSPLNYSYETVEDARVALLRLYTAISAAPAEGPSDLAAAVWSTQAGQRFKAAMDDDFNTPIAVSVLFDLTNELNRSPSAALAAQLRSLGAVLGLLQQDAQRAKQGGLRGSAPHGSTAQGLGEAQIETLVQQRLDAKNARNFTQADAIRQQLLEAGIVLEDSPQGSSWRRR